MKNSLARINQMKYILLVFCFVFTVKLSAGQVVPLSYNTRWTTQSLNSSQSMPCGGGDIGLNVWVENGELLAYVAKSGSFNEENALLKAGRIRLKFSPNPFAGKAFEQELHLHEGHITVKGENNGVRAEVKIWADVFQPVAHFEVSASSKITVEATYENWRFRDRVLKPRENWGNSYKWAAPKNNTYKKDSITFSGNHVVFYHQNAEQTIFDITVAQQGLDEVKTLLYNPLKNLVSGGIFSGNNSKIKGTGSGNYANTDFRSWVLVSRSPARNHSFQLVLYNAQVTMIDVWRRALDSISKNLNRSSPGQNRVELTQRSWAPPEGTPFLIVTWLTRIAPLCAPSVIL